MRFLGQDVETCAVRTCETWGSRAVVLRTADGPRCKNHAKRMKECIECGGLTAKGPDRGPICSSCWHRYYDVEEG